MALAGTIPHPRRRGVHRAWPFYIGGSGDRRGPFQRFCERSVLRSRQDHSFGRGRFRRRCQPCRINSGIPTRSRYGARTPISTICGPSNPPTRLNSTASGVATPSVISKTLRQAPTTPLKRRLRQATRPAHRLEKTAPSRRTRPESQTATPLDSKNPWSRTGQERPGFAEHKIRRRTAQASFQ